MVLLEVEGLSFSYPAQLNGGKEEAALSDVSLTVNEGEFVVICGRSGCGKTTLLRLLKRELAPVGKKEGIIKFRGVLQEMMSDRDSAAGIGFVMQDPESQIVTDKVWHELAFGMENLGFPTADIRRKTAEIACYFGIDDWFRMDTGELSGGQKQILNLASSLAPEPELIILDEPTSQLDPIAASDFLNTLVRINREFGLTVIMTEHNLEEVFPEADRAVVMNGGSIVAEGTPRHVSELLHRLPQAAEMSRALPSAVRIYQSLDADDMKCPMTVREGKEFLERAYANAARELPREEKLLEKPFCGKSALGKREEHIDIRDSYVDGSESTKEGVDTGSGENVSAVSMRGICFSYGKNSPDILDAADLEVRRGETLCILGGNGAGKTTLLSVIAGARKPYRGKLEIFGKKIQKYTGNELYLRNLALLPQNPETMFIRMSLKEDYFEIRKVLGCTTEEMEQRIEEMSHRLGIEHLLGRHPYDLSGGEKEKAAIGKALLSEPKLLLMDEPTKGIDAWAKSMLTELTAELKADGLTAVIVTHDVEFAAHAADRCALFFDHRISVPEEPEVFFSGNRYYTTPASRISRSMYDRTVTCEQVVRLARMNGRK